MNITFQEEGHLYAIDSRPVRSVTQILESEGMHSYAFATEDHRDRGTAVHSVCDLIDGEKPWEGTTAEEIVANSLWDPASTDESLVPYGYAWAGWLLTTGFRRTHWEQKVGSAIYQFAGRLDRYGIMDGKRTLVDIKSGQPQPAANIQTALYDFALEETLGLKSDRRVVVWLRKDATFKMPLEYQRNGTHAGDLTIGLAVVQVYGWRKANRMFT